MVMVSTFFWRETLDPSALVAVYLRGIRRSIPASLHQRTSEAQPSAEHEPELREFSERVAAVEDAPAVEAHFFQQARIDGAHDFRGNERPAVHRRARGLGGAVEFAGAHGFEIHQREEGRVAPARREVF